MTSFAVMKNVLRRIVRDVRTMALIVILPLFFVLLYGNSFSGSYSDLEIVVVNADNGLASVRTAELGRITLTVDLDATEGAALSWLHRHAEVLDQATSEEGRTAVRIRIDPTKEGVVRGKFGSRVRTEPGRPRIDAAREA